jgi:hypothetical protein
MARCYMWLATAVAVAVASPQPPAAPLVISAGQCDWAIVRPSNPNCFEVRGSESLRDEISAATHPSCIPALQREDQPRTEPHNIYVGNTERLRATGRLGSLGEEEAAFFVDGANSLCTRVQGRYKNISSCVVKPYNSLLFDRNIPNK